MSHLPAELGLSLGQLQLASDCNCFCDWVELLSRRITVGELLSLVSATYADLRDGTLAGSRFAEIAKEIEDFGHHLKQKYGV